MSNTTLTQEARCSYCNGYLGRYSISINIPNDATSVTDLNIGSVTLQNPLHEGEICRRRIGSLPHEPHPANIPEGVLNDLIPRKTN